MFVHLSYFSSVYFYVTIIIANKITMSSSGVVSSMADKMSPLFKTNPHYKLIYYQV